MIFVPALILPETQKKIPQPKLGTFLQIMHSKYFLFKPNTKVTRSKKSVI